MQALRNLLWRLVRGRLPWTDEEREITPSLEEVKDWLRNYGKVQYGSHFGVVHNWIKWKFCMGNGETVTWGSDEVLRGGPSLTPALLEDLAQQIREGVIEEFSHHFLIPLSHELVDAKGRADQELAATNYKVKADQIWQERQAFEVDHDPESGYPLPLYRKGKIIEYTVEDGEVESVHLMLDKGTEKFKTVLMPELLRDWILVQKATP